MKTPPGGWPVFALRKTSAITVWSSNAALFVLEFLVFLAETFNPAGRVDQLLFTGKKGMALGADFNPNVLFRGTCLYHIPASALDGRLNIIRMNVRFHDAYSSPYLGFMCSSNLEILDYPLFLAFFQAKIPYCPTYSGLQTVCAGSKPG
jgi:hypothetical protein